MDPDLVRYFVGPDLGTNCLQGLLADNNDGFHGQELFEEINFEKKISADDKHKHAKLLSMQRFLKGPNPEYSRAERYFDIMWCNVISYHIILMRK